ncbi:Metallo-dependent phosphatase [Trichocladium antarcticum]|uniref:Metallo-dependent phosphatase n=1 Tax=Trichocladium antarcticum TaxID=1450529 RepID=A0AAN6Z9F5_9PEZI|nr:Metallo-dependent phosphatase [Trichocladium antarcticum]
MTPSPAALHAAVAEVLATLQTAFHSALHDTLTHLTAAATSTTSTTTTTPRHPLRRASPWSTPTLLDHLLTSPLQHTASLLYRHVLLPLRGPRPFRPPRHRAPIRVVCLSDTHGILPAHVPPGDVLVHCGDLSRDGSRDEIQRQVDWMRGLEGFAGGKVLVGGNHDAWLDPRVRGDGEGEVDFTGVEYLCDRMVQLRFEGGRRLNVYGWGTVPWCGEGFAYQYPREKHPWAGRIPDETDILVTHTPPAHHCDNGLGCAGLLEEVWRVKPKLHVFGHVHVGHGREAVYFDECQRAYETLMAKPGMGFWYDCMPSRRWLDGLNMLRYGIGSILWKWIMAGPGSNNGGLMVNAAVMYKDSGTLRNPVTVVDL